MYIHIIHVLLWGFSQLLGIINITAVSNRGHWLTGRLWVSWIEMLVGCSHNENTKIKMQFFGSPLTVYCDKSLTSRSIQRLPCVILRSLYRLLWLVNPSLTISAGIQKRRVDMKFTISYHIYVYQTDWLNSSPEETFPRQIWGVNRNHWTVN